MLWKACYPEKKAFLIRTQKAIALGGECNLWSERIPNEKELDRKAFPRLLAISEVLWSKNEKDYKGFQKSNN